MDFFFNLSIFPFTALTGISGRILLTKHKTYNLFPKRKMLEDVWDQLHVSVGGISCISFGVCVRTGWWGSSKAEWWILAAVGCVRCGLGTRLAAVPSGPWLHSR